MASAAQVSQPFPSVALDPIPYIRGLQQLIPERSLAAILTQTARASERRRRLPAESGVANLPGGRILRR